LAAVNSLGRSAYGDDVSANIFGDHGPSPNDCTASYVNSVQYLATGTDPNVLGNGNALLRQRLRPHRHIESRNAVICGDDDRMSADHRIPTNHKTSMPVEDTVRADVGVRPDLDAAAIRSNDDTVRDSDPLRDQNTPAQHETIGVDLDPRAPSNIRGRIDLDA